MKLRLDNIKNETFIGGGKERAATKRNLQGAIKSFEKVFNKDLRQ
jgi:hypothetical protein